MFYNYNELFLENEVWKDCVDWEEFYEISNFGRVKSKERKLFYEGGTVARVVGSGISNVSVVEDMCEVTDEERAYEIGQTIGN